MHCSLCGVSSNSGSHEERQKRKQKKKGKKKRLQTNPVYNKLSLTELQFGICRVFCGRAHQLRGTESTYDIVS